MNFKYLKYLLLKKKSKFTLIQIFNYTIYYSLLRCIYILKRLVRKSLRNKVGMICISTNQGISYMAKDFYENGLVDEVFVIPYPYPEDNRVNHYEWYPNRCNTLKEFFKKIDVLVVLETPYDWLNLLKAKWLGIKIVLIPMYECTNYPFPCVPDLILCPSALDFKIYTENCERNCFQIQIPVKVTYRLRNNAFVFVHNGGNGGILGRNGTKELIEAMKFVKSPIKLIIRSQIPLNQIRGAEIEIVNDNRIEFRIGQFDDIWGEGDVFIFPEKFAGLSLPLQEAFASGMLVMTSDRFPNNVWLPKDPLIPVFDTKKEKFTGTPIDLAIIRPVDIAQKIDEWYNKDISELSLKGRAFGENNTWDIFRKNVRGIIEKELIKHN